MIRYEAPSAERPDGRIVCEIGPGLAGAPFEFSCLDAETREVKWKSEGMHAGHWAIYSAPRGCHARLLDSSGRTLDYWIWRDQPEGDFFDYVEIGTSDFDTLVEVSPPGFRGLSVEPMRCYLDRLPDVDGNRKLNLAVSDADSRSTIFYVDPEDIASHAMPDWVKGCNSIGREHPGVSKYLSERGLSSLYRSHELECVSFQTLVSGQRIAGIGYLKIDTEGHDFAIIRSMLATRVRPGKIRFETNSLYSEHEIRCIILELEAAGYKVLQRTANDTVVRLADERDEVDIRPVLVISTGRRFEYLARTVRSLFDHDPGFAERLKSVWLLDDRSSSKDRFHIEKMMRAYFGEKCTTVYFNADGPYDFVEKFRFIRKVASREDIVMLLEDDWECCGNLSINYHCSNLLSQDWSQISFCDPLEIQWPETQRASTLGPDYWRNPYPECFKHPYKWNGDICYWNSGRIDNWTNNPSLVKGSVFHDHDFDLIKNFEWEFSRKAKRKAVFTNECLFRHFGDDSLIDKLP